MQGVAAQAAPQFFLVPFFPQRRGQHIFGALEAGFIVFAYIQQQILGAGFAVGHNAASLGQTQFLQGIITAEMDNIDRRLGHFGYGQGAVGAFRLHAGGAGQGVVFGFNMALCQCGLDQLIDD